MATSEPQYIIPIRLGLVEAGWLRKDLDACSAQSITFTEMKLDTFDPWELGELATWWRRSEMSGPLPASTPGSPPHGLPSFAEICCGHSECRGSRTSL